MKRMILLLILGISALFVNAQKENGTVYSEHESIAKTKALWAAFVKGDRELYESFFADSVWEEINGTFKPMLKKEMGNNLGWWKGVKNLTVRDDGTSTPDAINYTYRDYGFRIGF